MRHWFPFFPTLCAGLLAFSGPAVADVLLEDPFTVPGYSADVNFQVTTRQTGRIAPIQYTEAFETDFSQVGNPEVNNGLLLAARPGGFSAVSLNQNFTQAPGLGSTMVIEFDVNPVLILPGMNMTQAAYLVIQFGASTRNVTPQTSDGVELYFRGNGNFNAYNNKVSITSGAYASQDDLFHHIRIVIADATDGNPFNGNSPVTITAYADANAVPFLTYTRTAGFSSNFISLVAQAQGSGGDSVVRHGVDNLKISIDDKTAPTIAAPVGGFTPLSPVTGIFGTASLPDFRAQAVVSDNVAVTNVSQSPVQGTPLAVGTRIVTLTAQDASGNTKQIAFVVNVTDGTNPKIFAPEGDFTPLVITTDASGSAELPDYTEQAITSDNVAVVNLTQEPAPGSAQAAGTTNVILTASDAAGNTITKNFAVTVNDGTPPTIVAPVGGFAPTVVQVGANGTGALPNYTGLAVTGDNVAVTGVTQVPAIGATFAPGTRAVTLTAQDAAGNTTSINFNVEFIDVTAPTLAAPETQFTPLTIVTGEDGTVPLPNYTGQAVTADNVGVTSVTQSPAIDSPRLAGTTMVTVTAKDAAGNESSVNFEVTVADGTKPEIGAPEGNFTPLAITTGPAGTVALPDYTAQAVTSDNVAVTEVTQLPAPGAARVFGITTVTLTAHDAAGNTRDFSFDVTVQDGTNPTIAAPEAGYAPLGITTGVDGTVALPDYTGQAVTTDNVAVTQVTQSPAIGSAQLAGVTTVTLTAHDATGNIITMNFDVAVADGTKPEIAAPASGFTPATIVADEDGTAPLPDYTAQAVTSDNVGVTSVTQLPAPGDVRLFGKTVVTLTAHDAAGNTRAMSFDVFVTLDAPLVNTLAGVGGEVPGAGLDSRIPADAKFTGVGLPVIDDTRRIAFLGKWKSTSGAGVGIFAGDPLALLVKAGEDVPGLAGVQFKTLQDPLISPNGTLAFSATLKGQGIKAGNDFSVWTSTENGPALLLREGAQAPGAPTGALLKSVSGLSLRNGDLLVVGKLAPARGLVTAADDSVLLSVSASSGKVLLREGAPADLQDGQGASAIKKIESLLPAEGSSAQGRWHADGAAIARVTLADKRVAIVQGLADGTLAPRLAVGGPALDGAAVWKVLGLPAVEPSGHAVVVKGQLKPLIATTAQTASVTTKNDAVLAQDLGDGAGFTVFAREGFAPASAGGATYATFLDPIINDHQDVLFGATLAGSGVTAKNKTALFSGAPDSPFILARTGLAAPDSAGNPTSALWSKFTSYALPSGPSAAPVFTAKVAGSGVTAKNNVGLWAVDSTGLLRQLLRTGDLIGGKAVTGIHALTGVTGSLGATRGFNERGTVITRVSFAKGGQAILRIDIPEGQVRITSEAE